MLSKLMRIAGIGAVALLVGVGSVFGATYRVDTDYSTFEVQNDIRAVKGSFDQFDGQIVYEPIQVENSSVAFCLKANSFKVQNDGVMMAGSLFFDLNKHPEIQFESTKVENWGDKLKVTGTLSMLGITREVVIPVQILGRGVHPKTGVPIAGFAADIKIKLSDLGVDTWTNATGILGDTLHIRLKMVGVENDAQAQVKTKHPSKL